MKIRIVLFFALLILPAIASAQEFPALSGEKAIAHLQKQGLYQSLQEAFKDAWRDELADAQIKLTANDAQTDDTFFGFSVDVSANTAVVGCLNCKIGGNIEQGAVYVFVKNEIGWVFQQKLIAPDGASEDHFGGAVSIERNTIAVGATEADASSGTNRGAVYVFVRNETNWTLQQKLIASDGANNDKFGIDVSLSGETLAIGSSIANLIDPGAIYIFVRSGTNWTQQQRLAPSDGASNDLFGRRVGLDGDTVISGSSRHNAFNGAAYIFVRSGTVWTQQQKIIGSDLQMGSDFGGNVAVSGNTIVVGAIGNANNISGAAYVFVRNGTVWIEQQKLMASDIGNAFGNDVAISGNSILVGAFTHDIGANQNQGAVYEFARNGENWSQQRRLTATDGAAEDNFGFAVAIDGQTSIVGTVKDDTGTNADQGSAYIFECERTTQQQILANDGAAFDQFGNAIAVSGNTVVVGAEFEEDAGGVTEGAAYVFVRSSDGWTQQQKLKANPLRNNAQFGHSVAISGNTIVIGALRETNLNPPNPPTDTQGAAYVFIRNGTVWTPQARLVANDGAFNDQFGNAVAIDGETIVIGAAFDDVGAVLNQGSAYIFVRLGATWIQQARISSADGTANDNFGNSISISGETVAVGAFQKSNFQGAAYIFTRSGSIWSQQQKLTALDGTGGDEFGFAVSVSGETVAVGAEKDDDGPIQDQGSVYVFTRSGSIWSQQQKLMQKTLSSFAQFGYALALDGKNLIIGNGGGLNQVWVYTRTGAIWSVADEYAGATQSDFGEAVGISGETAAIGALARTIGGNSLQGDARIYYGDCSTAPVGVPVGAIVRRCKNAMQTTLGTVSDLQEPAGSLTVALQTVPAGITLTGLTNTNGTITANVGALCTAAVGANTVVLRVTDAAFGISTFNVRIDIIEKQNTADFDGDRQTDLSIFRPSNGQWWYQKSSDNAVNALTFGTSTDKITPADYDGDGKTDTAFWRPSTGQWFVLRSSNLTFYSASFGLPTDKPVRGDFDGDGKADLTVYRPSSGTWYILRTSDGNVKFQQFGISEDTPVPADYDDDGKDDIAVFRPSTGTWWIQRSTAGSLSVSFGTVGDIPVPGDYTGDGHADTAVFRPTVGVWYVLRSEDFSYFAVPFGVSTDTPVPGDYDGDGKFDFGIFRSSETNWYVKKTGGGTLIQAFGQATDTPVPTVSTP